MASDRVVQTMASAIIVQTMASARIAAHWEAKGTDIIGDNYTYIVRPELGDYMTLSDYRGKTVTSNRLHDSCLDGSHYFAYLDAPGIGRDYTYFHVIKESSFVRVTNLSTGAKRKEGTLHETCWGGDFYLATSEYHRFTSSPVFIIIFAKSGTFRAVSDLNSGKPSKHLQYDGREEYNLHPNCQNGLYYWSTKSYWGGNVWYYIVKGVDQSGMVEFHYTKDLRTDEHGATESFEATVVELLSLTSTAPSLNPWTGAWSHRQRNSRYAWIPPSVDQLNEVMLKPTSNPATEGRRPELYDLEYLENPSKTHSVQIINQVQGSWQTLIGHFRLPPHTHAAILAMSPYTPQIACREVFRQWLEGGDELLTPKDWSTVIEVMCRIGRAELTNQIHKILLE